MRIRCECGLEFTTPDHDEVVDFSEDAVVGPLGPDHVRDLVAVSRAHVCPHCLQGQYFSIALELTHLTAAERDEFERFMLKYYHRSSRRT
jgi:hypothetical protein